MLQQRAARLFRGVVLAGSALGCGARVDEPAEKSAEPSPGNGEPRSSEPAQRPAPAAVTPRAANTPANTPAPTVEAPVAQAAGPDLLIPPPPPRCEANQQLRCAAWSSSEPRGCTCEAIVPRSAADCARPEQFQCADAGVSGCSCDAPSAEPGCPGSQVWYCESYTPQTPCGCLEIRIR